MRRFQTRVKSSPNWIRDAEYQRVRRDRRV